MLQLSDQELGPRSWAFPAEPQKGARVVRRNVTVDGVQTDPARFLQLTQDR